MADDNPRDAVYVKFGRFQAGAYGRLGIIALVTIMLTAAKYLHVW